jgi:hypothetical protein
MARPQVWHTPLVCFGVRISTYHPVHMTLRFMGQEQASLFGSTSLDPNPTKPKIVVYAT